MLKINNNKKIILIFKINKKKKKLVHVFCENHLNTKYVVILEGFLVSYTQFSYLYSLIFVFVSPFLI